MSDAADAEDRTDKHTTTPGVPTPAREFYATMLLERSMAKEALAGFEATLTKEPNRFNAIAGAASAALMLNDAAKARLYFVKLTELDADSHSDRPALVAARAFLKK